MARKSDKYDLILHELTRDPLPLEVQKALPEHDIPPETYHQAIIVPRERATKDVIAELAPGTYVVFEGEGKKDDNDVPPRFVRKSKVVKPPPTVEQPPVEEID